MNSFESVNFDIYEQILPEPIQKINFKINDIEYNIKYIPEFNIVEIEAMAIESYLKWKKTISSALTESQSPDVQIPIEPESIFDILKKYNNGSLDPSIHITFPLEFTENKCLNIVIATTIPIGKHLEDIKNIILDVVNVTTEERSNYKINRLGEKIDPLEKEIESIKVTLQDQNLMYNSFQYAMQCSSCSLDGKILGIDQRLFELKTEILTIINKNDLIPIQMQQLIEKKFAEFTELLSNSETKTKSMSKNIRKLNTKVTNINNAIDSTNAKYTEIGKNIVHLHDLHSQINNIVHTQTDEIGKLIIESNGIRDDTKIIADQITELKSMNDSMKKSINYLEKNTTDMKDELAMLKTESMSEISSLKNQIKSLKDEQLAILMRLSTLEQTF